MKRVFIPLWKALAQAREAFGYSNDDGICACYDVDNMGFCKDGETRWYHFTSVDGKPAYTLKRFKTTGFSFRKPLVLNLKT